MDFDSIKLKPDLPISQYEEVIAEKFLNSSNLIVIGETGSGKTTQIPLIILKNLSKIQKLSVGKIAITQPRRIAATSVAEFVSGQVGSEIGKLIGYKIRFDEKVSDDSSIIFMTDGILLREMQLDPLLMKYSVVMVDEAHERNINSDFLIGMLIDIQAKRREAQKIPLKILVTSATLEKDKFVNYLSAIKDEALDIIEVPGRLFPIEKFLEKSEIIEFKRRAAQIVQAISTGDISSLNLNHIFIYDNNQLIQNSKNNEKKIIPNQGDILIFMPGKREIEETKEFIKLNSNYSEDKFEIITIHADLPIEEQRKIFVQTDKRKIVIATNIAETSLTVPGIVFVIDSGLIKNMEYDPHSGINSLITKPHAKKGLEQRMGRAGRIANGYYFGLYTKESLALRSEFPIPEILRSSLSQVVLIMKLIGIDDIYNFRFIDSPDTHLINVALDELKRLGALDEEENITEKGNTLVSLPLEPRLGNLILEASKNNCVEEICTIASFLELKPVIPFKTEKDFLEELVQKRLQENDLNGLPNVLTEEEIFDLEDHAQNDYMRYKKSIGKFYDHYSDFFTLMNIYKSWEGANFSDKWAEQNFLNYEVLIEAKNIREELLDIAKKAKLYNEEYKDYQEIKSNIEKTIISAFRYNALVSLKNGFYKNIRTGDKDVRIHNSSSVYNSRADFVITYEVIEIAEIDAEPKHSAKFVHALDERNQKKYFYDDYKKLQSDERKFRRDRFKNSNRRFKFKGKKRGGRKHGGRR